MKFYSFFKFLLGEKNQCGQKVLIDHVYIYMTYHSPQQIKNIPT